MSKMEGSESDVKKGKQIVEEEEPTLVMANTCNVPQEVVEDILTRVPVKPLARFRCISKQWRALLTTDPSFIQKHLNRTMQKEETVGLILQVNCRNEFYYLPTGEFDKAAKLHNPIVEAESRLHMVGSVNGLVCAYEDGFSKYGGIIYLWNPATREYFKLPNPHFKRPWGTSRTFATFGFIFQHTIEEYKVVRLLHYEDFSEEEILSFAIEVEVYSMRKNTWKTIGVFQYLLFDRSPGIIMNGALHWLGSRGYVVFNYEFILAFDMDKEEFRNIPLPHKMDRVEIPNIKIFLRMFRGCLSLFVDYKDINMELWVMEKYGVKESWTKVFTFVPETFIPYPIEFLRNGELLLQKDSTGLTYTYNLEGKECKEVRIHGVDRAFDITPVVYVESLVKPMVKQSEAELLAKKRAEEERRLWEYYSTL